jgi:pimeloyl-ACP methyl ester carboxylesterase
MNVLKRSLSLTAVCYVGLTASTAAIGQASPNQAFDKETAARAWWDLYFKDSQSVKLADGRTMNLMCEGEGLPVVILDAGMGNGAWTWRHVHAELARITRVCAYDRSGYGQSSRSAGERTAGAEADELGQLLERTELQAPYVLVGRSYAAYVDRLYASRHTNQVAALVLIDPSSEYQYTRFASVNSVSKSNDEYALSVARATCLPALRLGKLDPVCRQPPPPSDLPTSRADWWQQHALSLTEASYAEFVDMNSTSSEQLVAERRSLGSLPILILERSKPEWPLGPSHDQAKAMNEIWDVMHQETLSLSSNSKLEFVEGAGHQIQEDKPMAVAEAINGVVDQVRATTNMTSAPAK